VKNKILKILKMRAAKKELADNKLVPRITNQDVAGHREEILSGARKYIYPLQHSKHKVVLISSGLFLLSILIFVIGMVVSLYQLETTSNFSYQVTRVLPFPIARSGNTFIAYENYLFELRRYMHYYENQQRLSFSTESGIDQLKNYKTVALETVINNAYAKMLAEEQGVSVSPSEVDRLIAIQKEQNRLGSSDKVFEDTLKDFFAWSVQDYQRYLNNELLMQKLTVKLDPETEQRAQDVLSQLRAGADFKALATQYSDDESTKQIGGEFGVVDKGNRNVSPQTVDKLFKTVTGEVSDIIIVPYADGYALEIVKTLEITGDKAKGAHILFKLKDVSNALNDKKEQKPYKLYLDPSK
jgi:foldase protein PrsA